MVTTSNPADLSVGFATSIGKRKENQDSGFALRLENDLSEGDGGLISVCDGMGGYPKGRAASHHCTSVMSQLVGKYQSLKCAGLSGVELEKQLHEMIHENTVEMVERLRRAYRESRIGSENIKRADVHEKERPAPLNAKSGNDDVEMNMKGSADRSSKNDQFSPSAFYSTISGALSLGKTSNGEQRVAYWWIGDCRIYLLRNGRLEKLSTDHSKVEEMGLEDWEKLGDPEKSAVTHYVSPDPDWYLKNNEDFPPLGFINCRPGDVLVACSDGLWESCQPWALEAVLGYFVSTEPDPDKACERILQMLEPNLDDNSTLAMMYVGTPSAWEEHAPKLDSFAAREKGIRSELMDKLNQEISTEDQDHGPEWESGGPVWTSFDDREETERLTNNMRDRVSSFAEATGICLSCGEMERQENDMECCENSDLYSGLYMKRLNENAGVTVEPIRRNTLYLISRKGVYQESKEHVEQWLENRSIDIPGDLSNHVETGSVHEPIFVDDPFVSAAHMLLMVPEGDCSTKHLDLYSENGVYKQSTRILSGSEPWSKEVNETSSQESQPFVYDHFIIGKTHIVISNT